MRTTQKPSTLISRDQAAAAAAMVVGEGAAADERVISKHLCRLAILIENGFDFLFVVIAVEYMVLVLLAFLYCDNWLALGGAAFLLPYFVFMLHLIPGLKSVCIEKYVTNKQQPPAGKV